jgi:exonuclease III
VDEWYSRYLELQIKNLSVGCLYCPHKDKKVLLEKLSEKSGMCR